MLVKRWSLESQEDARYYWQSKTRTGWTVFVEAPTASGRISPLDAKWICGDGRLSRIFYPFPQVPPPLLACQASDNSLPLHTVVGDGFAIDRTI